MAGAADYTAPEDPDEPVIAVTGKHAFPRHPATMKEPYVYKLTFLGPAGAGKTAVASRLVAHNFDPTYRPTLVPQQLFWRHHEEDSGRDILVEIEDVPGIPGRIESGSLTKEAEEQLKEQLKPLVWFEKYRRDDAGGAQGGEATESDPLLAGLPTAKAKKKAFDFAAIKGMLPKEMFGEAAGDAAAAGGKKGKGKGKANPIVEHRKRMGFVVVADTSSSESFDCAYAVIDKIFERLLFDISDNIECPVSLVIVGNKADKRGARDCAPEAEMKELVLGRFENLDSPFPIHNVLYLECSASTNVGIERIVLESLRRVRALPERARIQASRRRVTGIFGKFSTWLCVHLPFLFEVEVQWRKFSKAARRFLSQFPVLSLLLAADGLLPWLSKQAKKGWRTLVTCRWICEWCPPVIRRYRKTIDEDERLEIEAEAEREAEDARQRENMKRTGDIHDDAPV